MVELGRNLSPGNHRINITSAGNNTLRYAGELFQELLKREGVEVRGTIGFSRVPPNLPVLYAHASTSDLRKIIAGLLLYSNNFIANQLFLTCGAHVSGYPATWEKARQAMKNFLAADIGLDEKSIFMEEGSGLSRKNRVTPRAMARILEKFSPYADLLASDGGVRLKSGTLAGVFSYAGYFKGRQGLQPFVLILNQRKNTRDTVLKILRHRFAETDKQH
jgi:D-alanyl-D-alanine carboxypeptidase/D-alanyl-D-alanine-endopeptidase (penicillin-binding protein 4)